MLPMKDALPDAQLKQAARQRCSNTKSGKGTIHVTTEVMKVAFSVCYTMSALACSCKEYAM